VSGGRRRRIPSEAELALWAKVAATVEPLSRAAKAAAKAALEAEIAAAPPPPVAPEPASAEPPPAPTASRPTAPPPPPPLAPLESRFRRRLARGVVGIDARIDLHGLRQDDAHRRLTAFLAGAQARGHKLVLVITGKGAPGADAFVERGVLRRAVPLWLAAETARGVVVGFEAADAVHGGAGALYVRIRRVGRR
jgi:DNA-nicking Smr family endonuclease